MAGQQQSFLSGFPTVQQSAMHMQFDGGQISGLMGPQQGKMPNSQQILVQQQQPQQSIITQQQMQQIQRQLQLQQQQQAAMVQQNNQNSNNNQATIPQTSVPPTQPPLQQQQIKMNMADVSRFGLHLTNSITIRTRDLFFFLKTLKLPNDISQRANIGIEKYKNELREIERTFKSLRVIYKLFNEQSQGMEYTHIESLIPLKEEWDMKSDEKKTSEAYRLACEESKEIMEQVILKNNHIKEIIDHLRRIILEINTTLIMRKS